ncbi:uncharacterized protein LOC110973768 [Acanthaster planci]|uniref:Uncharacterized protein LOC110973768 n=1 Tax=Acanthaster planci TaxID=133434 RepID=A0A8B7XIC5_ACAPL|nr:uncharacterized protein LOC110973768 [Acanthaster planci]XP_022080547.1 uncharacterized protein LOC110973768 [Acanthaster planci]XP_022080548.1 uncharacterized protein LOC110973768 [Acanthaster planci]
MAAFGDPLDTSDECTRLRTGYLDQLNLDNGKVRKRWVIFQGNQQSGLFQLKIYKNDKEKILKSSYTLTKETLVGTERGALQKPKKKREKSAYWAVILVTDTVVFQEPAPWEQGGIGMELRSWDTVVKSYFSNESWVVKTLKGFVAPEFQMTLHVTRHALSLVTMNPPKCCKRWELSRISDYWSREGIFYFKVDVASSAEEDFEMKAESESHARRIRLSLDRVLTPGGLQPLDLSTDRPPLPSDRAPSPERYTPSPTLQKKLPTIAPPALSGEEL